MNPVVERVKVGTLAICRGNCNQIAKIYNSEYQLCRPCKNKFRFYGHECDIPSCESVSDGTKAFDTYENKILCLSCFNSWRYYDMCHWDKFLEIREASLNRPKTFVKALEEGLVDYVKNPVKQYEIAECRSCSVDSIIKTPKFQLCSRCSTNLQYYGEKCSLRGSEPCPNDAIAYDAHESRFVCGQCLTVVSKYKISSYMIYESQIRTKTECKICSTTISHNAREGEKSCTAVIDHDHETGAIRGVLCQICNRMEGLIKSIGQCPEEWGKNLKEYLENPPLTKSWAQES